MNSIVLLATAAVELALWSLHIVRNWETLND